MTSASELDENSYRHTFNQKIKMNNNIYRQNQSFIAFQPIPLKIFATYVDIIGKFLYLVSYFTPS